MRRVALKKDEDVTSWPLEKQLERVVRQRNELYKIIRMLDSSTYAESYEFVSDDVDVETSMHGPDLVIRITNMKTWKTRATLLYRDVLKASRSADTVVGNLYTAEGYNPKTGDSLVDEVPNHYRQIAEKYTKPWE